MTSKFVMCTNEQCVIAITCLRSRLSGTRPAKWQAWDDFGAPEYSRCRGLMTKIYDTDGDRKVAG